MELLNSNKVLYDGVTVFNVYFSFQFEKKIFDNNYEK